MPVPLLGGVGGGSVHGKDIRGAAWSNRRSAPKARTNGSAVWQRVIARRVRRGNTCVATQRLPLGGRLTVAQCDAYLRLSLRDADLPRRGNRLKARVSYPLTGVRPSSAAANSARSSVSDISQAGTCSSVAAPEDGRTPLNTFGRS